MDIQDLLRSSIFISLKVSLLSTFLVVVIGIGFAFILSSFKFRGKSLVEAILTLPLVLPPTVLGFYLIVLFGKSGFLGAPLYELFGIRLTFSWYAASIASFSVALPLMIKTTKASFDQVDPHLIESSELLGHSHLQTFYRVILPLSFRGVFAGAILSFARGLGEFGATLMFAGNIAGKTATMPLAIYTFSTNGMWREANLLALFLTLFSIGFLLMANYLMKRRFIR